MYPPSDLVMHATSLDGETLTIIADRSEIVHYVTDRLLSLYNDVWRCPALDEELSPEQFRARLSLPVGSLECELFESGSVQIRLDADGMFTDHSIVVGIDQHGRPQHVGIE